MSSQLTSGIPPHKIRYHHILQDLEKLLTQYGTEYQKRDLKYLQTRLMRHYGLTQEELDLQGFKQAYRQLVEGL